MRLGSADASSAPDGTSTRSYYDTMSAAFGKGFDASLLLVAKTPDGPARAAWTTLAAELPDVKGVAAVGAPAAVSGGTLSTLQVVPTTAAQDEATSDLVRTLRSGVVKKAEAGTDLRVYVGGTTATNIDFASALTSKLPLFLVIIAVLGFLLLTLAFRSLLVRRSGRSGTCSRSPSRSARPLLRSSGAGGRRCSASAARARSSTSSPSSSSAWCSACPWTTTSSWSAGCMRNGPRPGTTGAPSLAG